MFRATIGLEVHVELKTKTKMFCGCPNDPHASEPNANICPICMGHPGTLPVPNYEAVQSVLKFGAAVGSTLADFTEFDRKNYFYPDIPKAYQISQYAYPLVTGGSLAGVALTRVHLEEDTARSQHDKGDTSLLDYNRAGVPLMELVTEPVIHDAETAGNFAKELQLLLRVIGISDANMEKGEMRIEANISVSNTEKLGTKVEVKNLNSFRSVEAAITYEIARHQKLIESGGLIKQETRGWDEVKQETYLQRSKETAKDYRYFPDPDIPKLKIDEIAEFSNTILKAKLPELPKEKIEKYTYLGLTREQVEILLNDLPLENYFALCVAHTTATDLLATTVYNLLTSDIAAIWDRQTPLLPVGEFITLARLLKEKSITSRVTKDLLTEFLTSQSVSITDVVSLRSLEVKNDSEALSKIVTEIVVRETAAVEQVKAGKLTAIQYLVGQAMRETRGAADPQILATLFEKVIKKS